MSNVHEIAGILAIILVFVAGGFTIYMEGLKYYKKVKKDIMVDNKQEELTRLRRLK